MRTDLIPLAAILAAALAAGCAKHKTPPSEAPPTAEPKVAAHAEDVKYEEMVPPPVEEELDLGDESPLDESDLPEDLQGPDLNQLVEEETAVEGEPPAYEEPPVYEEPITSDYLDETG